ncbi:MAG: hypothetical protein M1822_000151 [Bathelium mastoideum]|nr:MAG: hypothetical protein M1822_000151 [Bathelium mastoideum]
MAQTISYTVILLLAASLAGAAPTTTDSTALTKRTNYDGVATYYYQNGAAGSCGVYHSDSDYIAALSTYWDVSSYCGRQIQITNTGGGQDNGGTGNVITVTVADTCESCDETHLDLSTGAFESLTDGNLDPPGEFNINWHFV